MINKFKECEVMLYYERTKNLSENLKQKRQNIIDNKDDLYIASHKRDGEFVMCIRGVGDDIVMRGRRRNVKGLYENKLEKVPHLAEEMLKWPENTVVLGELCWSDITKVSTDVGTIMRCLPAKAIERQKDDKLVVRLFDMLMIKGVDISSTPYEKRVETLRSSNIYYITGYFQITEFFSDKFQEHTDRIIAAGGEGVVIQRKDNPYEFGSRSAWKTLKLKQTLEVQDLLVVGLLEPKRQSSGETSSKYWDFIIDGEKVTKAYYYGWKAGVTCEYEGELVDVASGMTDGDKEYLSSAKASTLILSKKLYARVGGMATSSKGKVRHPVFNGFVEK